MHQFIVSSDEINEGSLVIKGDEAHHLIYVLRLKEGSIIALFDGKGSRSLARIENIARDSVQAHILETLPNNEPPIEVILYQALPKRDKLEFIIQKAVELGVSQIIPIVTKRTIVRMNDRKTENRVHRWDKISLEACKQAGRSRVPAIGEPMFFNKAVKKPVSRFLLMPFEGEDQRGLKQVLAEARESKTTSIGVFIGPEGGWDSEEVAVAKAAGVITVSLGPRILRTETASMAVLSMIMYELGDLGG
ncbi:MAG: 16S rRNA (uracil(1498)-N(3))-methyltransferase [Bacillota bacterium]